MPCAQHVHAVVCLATTMTKAGPRDNPRSVAIAIATNYCVTHTTLYPLLYSMVICQNAEANELSPLMFSTFSNTNDHGTYKLRLVLYQKFYIPIGTFVSLHMTVNI